MNHSFKIEFLDIILRPLQIDDIEDLRNLRNELRWFFVDSDYVSRESQKKWFEHYLNKTDDLMFCVINNAQRKMGYIALYNIDLSKRDGEFGRIMIRPNKEKIGTKSIISLLKLAKEQLMLKKIYCSVKKDNKRAISVYERIGFSLINEDDSLFYYSIELGDLNIESLFS